MRRTGKVPTVVGSARRRVIAVLAGLVLVAGAGLVVYRVFAPGEVFAEPSSGYPAAPTPRPAAVLGTLPAAPLIVDGRLRVVADKRQVRADGPVDSRYLNTPYWSFRRWPAELVGVVAAGTTVVTRWSDGELVGLDARTGRATWRAKGEKPTSPGYAGRRTGAQTVYEPPGLFLAGNTVVVAGATATQAYDATTGAAGWHDPAPCGGPDPAGFTTADNRVAVLRACDTAITLLDAGSGAAAGSIARSAGDLAAEPLDCAAPRSGCAGLRLDQGGHRTAWLFDGQQPRQVGEAAEGSTGPGLAAADAWLVDGLTVRVDGTAVVAANAGDGAARWRHDLAGPDAQVIAVQPGTIHVLTADRDLITLDAATGAERSRIRYTYFAERTNWVPGYTYAVRGFVLTERLAEPAAEDDADYYFDAQPVLLARS
ncbi:PQQ-binding-like beta-propeller repeat protein [Asanoa sp. NPDC049573]|uniref:outer membrane protein assembly factor BamB family protein n=1 Tax=Asanoa sp. NPDC049573 TaxID=3155396 RepID=UPI00344AFDB7